MRTSTLTMPPVEVGAHQVSRRWRLQPRADAMPVSRLDCLQRLADEGEGRLHHLTGVGPRALVVRYARQEGGLWIAVPDCGNAGHGRSGQEMALEVEGVTDQESWVVVVAGRVQYVDPARCPGVPLRGLSRHQALRHLFLPATVVFGFSC